MIKLPADIARCAGIRPHLLVSASGNMAMDAPCPLRDNCLRFLSPAHIGYDWQVYMAPSQTEDLSVCDEQWPVGTKEHG